MRSDEAPHLVDSGIDCNCLVVWIPINGNPRSLSLIIGSSWRTLISRAIRALPLFLAR